MRTVITHLAARCFCATALALGAWGCAKKSTTPTKESDVFYVSITHPSANPPIHQIYLYASATLTLCDSLETPAHVRQLTASRDGAFLFAHTGSVLKLDARTGAVVWSTVDLPLPMQLLLEGDLLLAGNTVRDPSTGLLAGILPDSLSPGYGPEDGTEIAAVVSGTNLITLLDCTTGATRGRYIPTVNGEPLSGVYYMRLHADRTRVLVIGIRSALPDSWFVMGDLETGETLLAHGLVYPFGEVIISGDGSLAAVTDPSRDLIYDSTPTLDLFDLRTSTHLRRFGLRGDSLIGLLGQARFLRDENKLILAPGGTFGIGPLYQINLETLEVGAKASIPGCDSGLIDCPYTGGIAVGPPHESILRDR